MAAVEISVVIPTYNRRNLLREMLSSLSQQTFPSENFEVLVVSDGSTDGTCEMVREFEGPYSLQVFQRKQAGVAAARNHGASQARGHHLVFLDDDLLPFPQLLEEHHRTQNQDQEGVVLGHLIPAGIGKRGGWNIWEDRVLENHYRAMLMGQRPAAGRRLYSGNFSVPREPFIDSGGFDEDLKRGEDVELGFRLEKSGLPFYYNHGAVAIHRGYRTFSSWCNSSYLYGHSDVALAVIRGHGQVLPEIFGWYYQKHVAIRWMVRLCMGRQYVRSVLLRSLRAGSGAATVFGLTRVAHWGYSSIFGLQYWQGVADGLGGREVFQSNVLRWSPTPSSAGSN